MTFFTNLLVANAALLFGASVSHSVVLLASLTFSSGLTGMVVWSLIRQAHRSARLAEELRQMVFRDRLTDVATRDFLFDRLSRRPEVSGVVLMLDIDHFKRVNDSYGHLAGDAVIRSVATQLRQWCRKEDIVCRFGGEEFLVFLTESDVARGTRVAERLRRAVEDAVTRFDNCSLRVTISIGGAVKPPHLDMDAAIRAADDALYQAKNLGRNCVALSWQEPPQPKRQPAKLSHRANGTRPVPRSA